MTRLFLAGAAATAISAGAASAQCGDGRVSIIGNEFPAIQTIGAAAIACEGVDGKANLTADHQTLNVPGMTGDPAEYTTAIVANSSIVALINEDVIQPLNDLVEAYAPDYVKPNQFIRVGDDILAVAFMANAQHLVYRADVLEQVGLEPPTTYEEMLAAAKEIRDAGIMENPIGGAYAAGWNLAQEFNNMFIGYGGQFFEPGTANPSVNSEAGINALNMMKALSEYMNPDFLTHDSNATNAEYRAGNVALMNMWGSRAATLTTAEGVLQEVIDGHAIAGPLTVGGGDTPASTLWWDGWTLAKNVSDEDAEATFKAMMAAISPDVLNEETMSQAVWLIDGYQPTEAAAGVFAAVEMGTTPYPMLPYMGLMHTALGAELSDFMAGRESAEQALADVEAAYTAAAREQGFLN
jgi:hypothetical protein